MHIINIDKELEVAAHAMSCMCYLYLRRIAGKSVGKAMKAEIYEFDYNMEKATQDEIDYITNDIAFIFANQNYLSNGKEKFQKKLDKFYRKNKMERGLLYKIISEEIDKA